MKAVGTATAWASHGPRPSVIHDPNRAVAIRTLLIDRQAIRMFKERDERWTSMFGQRLPPHDLVRFTFNLIACHGLVGEQ
jgi:hypothetical protein